jgi:hypothetical protein
VHQFDGPAGCVTEDGGHCAAGRGLTAAVGSDAESGRPIVVRGVVCKQCRCDLRPRSLRPHAQPTGGNCGCISRLGADRCSRSLGLFGSTDLAVAPDGTNVYAVGPQSDSLASFTREPGTGALRALRRPTDARETTPDTNAVPPGGASTHSASPSPPTAETCTSSVSSGIDDLPPFAAAAADEQHVEHVVEVRERGVKSWCAGALAPNRQRIPIRTSDFLARLREILGPAAPETGRATRSTPEAESLGVARDSAASASCGRSPYTGGRGRHERRCGRKRAAGSPRGRGPRQPLPSVTSAFDLA